MTLLKNLKKLLVLCLAGALMVACAEPVTPEGSWTGTVDGSDVALGLVVGSDGTARAYLCGGGYTRSSWTRWLDGVADPDGVTAEADGWIVHGTFDDDDNLFGTVSGPEGTFSFAVDAASDIEGLYTGAEDACPSGLVIWQGANGLVAQGAWCREGIFGQVEPVAPMTLTPEGVQVRFLGSHARFPKGMTAWFTRVAVMQAEPSIEVP